jgi:PEP-CTERM motif
MNTKSHASTPSRLTAIVALAAALLFCLGLFTDSSSAKAGNNLRQLGLGAIHYGDTQSLHNPQYETAEGFCCLTKVGDTLRVNHVFIDGPDQGMPTELPAVGTSATHTLITQMTVDGDNGPGTTPVKLTGPADMVYKMSNFSPSDTGPFDIELLSLQLSGTDPVLGAYVLRESPTLASHGPHTLTPDVGAGVVNIDSFFDVFFELSLNSGPFIPFSGSMPMNLISVPEPSSIALAGAGIAIGGAMLRRRRRSVRLR